ncbi:MAG: hypothetical protein EA350_00690, partial [Gemmatimonadales bacterium]
MIDQNLRSELYTTLRRVSVASLLPILALGAFVLAPADVTAQQTGADQDRQSAVPRSATPALAPAPDPVPGGVPHPAHVFGFHPGDDYELADLGQLEDYFEQLAAASPRVQRIEIGRTF